MKKTLVISYTPRKGSKTKILFEEFVNMAEGKTEIEHVDLVETPPDLLLSRNLNLVMEWNAGKRDFTEAEQLVLSNHNQLIDQLLEADLVVLAFPIYNFTMPAVVKAWIDAIVVSDKTFSFTPESGFSGLCGDKKAVSIIVGGFDYKNSKGVEQYASSTLKQNFDFMGIASEQITALGVDQNKDQLEEILGNARSEIKKLVNRWYPN